MAVHAELFDGTVLEFPDGTDPAVIQSTAKRITLEKQKETSKEAPTEERTIGSTLRQGADIVPAIGQGALGLAEAGINLIPGVPNVDFAEGKQYLQELKSPATLAAEKKVQEAEGFLPTLQAYTQNPSAIVTGFGESIPAMFGGAGIARGLITKGLPALAAAATGEGAVGAALSAQQIREAQGGKDLSAGQSALAVLSGVVTGSLGALGGKVAQKLGVADIDQLLAAQKAGNVTPEMGSKLTAALKGAVAESVFEELPQSVQEQIIQNKATGRPWDEGIEKAAASGLAIAAVPGAGAGFVGQAQANKQIQIEKLQKEVEAARAAQDVEAEKAAQAKLKKAGKAVEPNVVYEEKLNKLLEGEPNVTGTDTAAVGASADLPGKPDTIQPDTGVAEPIGSGVDGTGKPVRTAQVRTDEVPAPLEIPADATPELTTKIEEYNKRQSEIAAGGNKNKINNQIKKNEKLLTEIKAVQPIVVSPKTQAAVDKLKQAVVQEAPAEPITPAVAVAPVEPTAVEAPVEETPVVEAPVEETPLQQVEAQQAEAEKLADQLMPQEVTAEAQTPTAPQAQEVVTEAQPEMLRRNELLNEEEASRIERVYQVKSTGSADVGKEVIEGYEANRDKQVEELAPSQEDEPDLSESDLLSEGLPAWSKLNTAEKLVYSAINKAKGPNEAVKALRDFRRNTEGNVNSPKDPNAALYELNRKQASKEHAIDLPRWQELSTEAQNTFLSSLPKLNSKNPTHSGKTLHDAFGKAAAQLEQEEKGIRGAHRLDVDRAKLKRVEQEAQARAQAETEAERAKAAEAVGKGEALSSDVKAKLIAGDISGVLVSLSTSAKGIKDQYVGREIGKFTYLADIRQEVTKVINRALAQALDKLTFDSTVVTDPNDPAIQRLQEEGKLAEYDPKTDTFYFTPKGFDEATVLHEIIHAGTVKIINKYFTDPASLTQEQRDAVEHLQKIYDFAKPRLAGKYKNAFENLYEFVAYALTENNFQNALSEIQSRRLTKYSKYDEELGPLNKSLWSKFTQALANMHGLVEANFEKFSWLMDDVYKIVAKQYFSSKQGLEGLYDTVNVDDLDPQQQELFDASVDKLMASVKTAEEADLLEGIFADLDKNGQMTVGSKADLDKLNRLLTKRYDKEQAKTKVEAEPVEKQKTTQVRGEKKLLGGKRGYEGNVLLEISEAFKLILNAPEAGIDVEPLAAKGKKQPKKAAGTTYPSAEAAFNAEVNALNKKRNDQLNGPTKIAKFKSAMTDKVGTYRKAVKTFQNIAEPLKRWQNRLDIAGKTIKDESREYDNVYEQLVGAAASAQALYGEKVQELENTLNKQLTGLTKLFKTDAVDMLNKLQMYVTALHEPERRRLVFLKKVPLRDDVKIKINGIEDTPNNFRDYIFDALNNLKDTPTQTAREQAVKLRKILDNIIFTNTGNLEAQDARDRKGTLNTNNIDLAKSKNKEAYDENSDKYIVEASYDPQRISQYLSILNNSPFKTQVMDALKTVKQIEEATIDLNKLGNYWSRPVDNRVAFYGFKHYVPFKGKPESAEEANRTIFQPDTEQASRDLQYYMPSFAGGRASSADNPIAQVVTDAKKAAFLAANNKVTQALANAIKHGHIDTVNGKRAPTKVIPFEERYKGLTTEEIKAKNTVFNYKEDGTIEVYAIKNQGILDSLRQPYKIWGEGYKSAFRRAGAVTRFVGQGFTRFNPFFAPWNAFRDTLTNLYNLNVDRGLVVAGKTLTNTIWYGVFDTMMGGGMITSARVTRMYNKGDITGIEKLAQNDKFARNFLEYVRAGGVVTYLQGVANISELREMEKVMSRGSTALTFDQLKEIAAYPFDMWFNGFENTARVAAYGAIKDSLLSKGLSTQEAVKEAAIATKELANFEQTGKFGSEMGSLYMFARAQATGAVRAIDSLSYIAIPVEKAMADLPENVKSDPAAMAKFKQEYNRRRIYSSVTAAALFGMGYMSFMMALSGSGDDDQGENIIEKDDMARWTRAMRFTIPGTDYMFQLPWGFGKGAFSAWGAQVAAYVAGSQSLTDMLGHSITIGMDSFIPIPASHIPVTKDIRTTGYSLVDTALPTVTRPVWEWFINTNGLGMEIQNLNAERGGKTPDAFISRANIPEYYKDTAEWLFESTDGKVNVSPDIMHFFASSYMNGISLLGQNLENASLLAAGDKEFNAKTDTIILNSFVGTRSDYYSREFNRVEEKIKEKKEILGGFSTLPDKYIAYTYRHPYDEGLVKEYEQDVNNDLKKLRSERKRIINDRDISDKERTEQLKDNKLTQQYIKAQLIAKYKYIDESLKTELDED